MRAYIYQVTNRSTRQIYIGLTRFDPQSRWTQHVYKSRRKPRTYFHRSIAKYGPDAFEVETVATCIDTKDAWLVERAVIEDRKPEFNMTNGGEFTVGKRVPREVVERIKSANTGKKRTPEQNARMSELKHKQLAESPEYRVKVFAALERAKSLMDRAKQQEAARQSSKNRVWAQESRAKLSASRMGIRLSDASIAKMAASKSKRVECVSLGAVFASVSDAAKASGLSISGVSRVCRGDRRSANGLIFRFL